MRADYKPGVTYAMKVLERLWRELPRYPEGAAERAQCIGARDILVQAMRDVSGNQNYLPKQPPPADHGSTSE